MARTRTIISLFIFHFQFIPLIYSFSFFFSFFSFFLLFSCLISQANTTQNSKRESFPPFSISLTFSLLNFIDLRQTTYFYNNSFPSSCTSSFNEADAISVFFITVITKSLQIGIFSTITWFLGSLQVPSYFFFFFFFFFLA